jgi:hypothetical protein
MAEHDAAEIEERYFTDKAFFRELLAVEDSLIGDYLEDRLSLADKKLFEARYLAVPLLQQKLAAASELRGLRKARKPLFWGWRQFATAAAVALIAVVLPLNRSRPDPSRETAARIRRVESPNSIPLSLSPGVLKAAGRENVLTIPSGTTPVQLELELPGVAHPVACAVRLYLIGPVGDQAVVWSSATPLLSNPRAGGQNLTFLVDVAVLLRGDYVIEVASIEGQVRETYSFRVLAPP